MKRSLAIASVCFAVLVPAVSWVGATDPAGAGAAPTTNPTTMSTKLNDASYGIGYNMGKHLEGAPFKLDVDQIVQGLRDAHAGKPAARGLTNYAAAEVEQIKGMRTADVRAPVRCGVRRGRAPGQPRARVSDTNTQRWRLRSASRLRGAGRRCTPITERPERAVAATAARPPARWAAAPRRTA